MEKRDLEVKYYERMIGAFENVTNVVEGVNENGQATLSFDSDDGHFDYTKQGHGLYEDPNHLNIKFTSYNVQVRRTTQAHCRKHHGTLRSMDVNNYNYGPRR